MSEESEEAEKLIGTISELSFSGCSSSCTVTAQNLPYEVELDATGSGDGTLDITSGGSGNPRAKANCFGLECLYGTSKAQLKADGGTPAIFEANKVTLNKEGGSILCGSKVEWDADYELTEYESVFFVEAGQTTTLCEAEPTKEEVGKVKFLKCPKGKKYGGTVKGTLMSGGTANFLGLVEPAEDIKCTESELTGKFNVNGTSIEDEGVISWTFNSNKGACTSTLKGKPPVTVTVKDLHYDSSRLVYRQWFPNEGTVTFEKAGSISPKLEIGFGKSACGYDTESSAAEYINDNGTKASRISMSTKWKLVSSVGAGCPKAFGMGQTLEISRPGGGKLYLAEKGS